MRPIANIKNHQLKEKIYIIKVKTSLKMFKFIKYKKKA